MRFLRLFIGHRMDQNFDSIEMHRAIALNGVCIGSIIMAFLYSIVAVTFKWPAFTLLMVSVIVVLVSIPVVLNRIGRFKEATMSYILIALLIVFPLPILFGTQYHFQLFFIGGLALPFVLLDPERGTMRVGLSLAFFIGWLLSDGLLATKDGLVPISVRSERLVILMNYVLTFAHVGIGTYLYTFQSYSYRKLIDKQYADLKQVNDQLEKFSYTVSHDLKGPISNIKSLSTIISEELREREDETKGLQGLVDLIEKSCDDSMTFIRGILDYSKAVNFEALYTEFKLSDLAERLQRRYHQIEKLEIDIDPEMPDLYGSEVHFEQVIQNLVDNGIKYNDKPLDQKYIGIKAERVNSKLLKITVSDNGPGIPKSNLKSIFNLFEKSQARNKESSGIGLAIVKGILEKNGAEIWVDSKLREGSSFSFNWKIRATA